MIKLYRATSLIDGQGLFAGEPIKCGGLVGKFKGKRTNKSSKHTLWVYDNDEYVSYHITNLLKYANHSDDPNVEVIHLEMYALRDIEKDEEITFHYGEDW